MLKKLFLLLLLHFCSLWMPAAWALEPAVLGPVNPGAFAYVLGDSIAQGLELDGLPKKYKDAFGGTMRINFDGNRSIIGAGSQVRQSGLETIEADKEYLAKASTIIIELGMTPAEPVFTESQRQLLEKMRVYAPKARYFWVDIAGTVASHVDIWSERNKAIYANAAKFNYTVISRVKSIFGATADPLKLQAGLNFPGWASEPGFVGGGNIHGYYPELSNEILSVISGAGGRGSAANTACPKGPPSTVYVLGDSIAYGLNEDGFSAKLKEQWGSTVRISFDVGRSILTPGVQIRKTGMESIELDKDFIAKAGVVIVVLGTNMMEASFEDAQASMMLRLKSVAPQAKFYWVDIGATLHTQAQAWSLRNKTIYQKAPVLGYSVISRYKAIFGPDVDPLQIEAGKNYPYYADEDPAAGKGNIHGMADVLSQAIIKTLAADFGCATKSAAK